MQLAVTALDADHRNVATARRFVADMLALWGRSDLDWAATTVISELATNAVLHARTPFMVTMRLDADVLRLEVADGSAASPRRRHHGTEASTGRGMRLVDRLARAHGVHPTCTGKAVWCELAPGSEGRGEDEADALASFLLPAPGEPADEGAADLLAQLDQEAGGMPEATTRGRAA
ncbi:MAG: ATP-binding protein [Actinomycetes bacterium]